MKYGICEWSLPVQGSIAIRMAKEAGFQGMQIGEGGGIAMGFPMNDPFIQSCYLEASNEYGIEFQGMNLGALLGSGDMKFRPDSARGERAGESIKKGFEACKALGVPKVVLTLESEDELSFMNNILHLRYAEELSRETGVGIAIESALPLPEIMRILNLADPEDKICMDLLNPLRFGTGDPKEQIKAFGKDRIDHFHFKDSRSSLFYKGQRGCVLLGAGDADLRGSCDLIRSMGFDCWAVSENYYQYPPLNDGKTHLLDLLRSDLNNLKKLI